MSDEKKKPDIIHKPLLNPLLASLPPHLKDPANYEKIRRAIYDAFSGACGTHADVMEMAGCAKCQRALQGRAEVFRKLGFRNAAQYMAWQKVHETIKKRVPFAKYNQA